MVWVVLVCEFVGLDFLINSFKMSFHEKHLI